MPHARETLEQVFRAEYALIIASLIRRSGSFDLAEESLQEAFSMAVATWERDGIPRNPAAWLSEAEARGQKSEVRGQRSEIRDQKSEDGDQKTEDD